MTVNYRHLNEAEFKKEFPHIDFGLTERYRLHTGGPGPFIIGLKSKYIGVFVYDIPNSRIQVLKIRDE